MNIHTVPGPCAELVSLLGRVTPDIEAPMQVLVGDSTGALHGGRIDPARSPVAVTDKLFLTLDLDTGVQDLCWIEDAAEFALQFECDRVELTGQPGRLESADPVFAGDGAT